jgi:hypothetical protein
MDNNSILNGFQYTFAIMLVLLVLVYWQVYFVHRPKINTLQIEHESGLSCSTIEGMGGAMDINGRSLPYQVEVSDALLANPGYTKQIAGAENLGAGKKKSAFFGGSEPPVFYDIGNVQAAVAMRSKGGYTYSAGEGQDGIVQNLGGGYSIIQKDGKSVLAKDGVAITDTSSGGSDRSFYRSGTGADAKYLPCPTAEHRTSADGLSCYIPEGMADPLMITTSGFGQRDPFADIEDTVYGG